MKKLTSSAVNTGNTNVGASGLLPKEKLTFEEYNKSGKVMGFHDSVITPKVVQKNIISKDKSDEHVIGYIPVKEISYLSLQYQHKEICDIIKANFKSILSHAKFIKTTKSAKDKDLTLVGYFHKDTIFKLNELKTDESGTIFDSSLKALENFTEKDIILKTLGNVIDKEKGLCYDDEGKVFVVFNQAKVFAEVIIPSCLTTHNPKIKLEDIPKIVKETAYKYITVTDVKVDDEKFYGAVTCKGSDSDLIVKLSTANFVAMNTSTNLHDFVNSIKSSIAQILDKTIDDIDVKFIDIVKFIDTNNRNDKTYQKMISLTGADSGVVKSVLVINTDEFVKKDKERTDLFGSCNSQVTGFKESDILKHPFWKYLTTNIIVTYLIDNKAYFLPDIKKVALFKYFGGAGYYSPLKYNKVFAVSTSSDEKTISFAMHI